MDSNITSSTTVDLLKHFDKVYCINLDRRTDRLEYVSKEFAKWGIQGVELFKAIDGATLSKHPGVSNGALGLLMTTYNIILEARALGCRNVLILEDDVYFRETINDLDAYMNELPPDWDLLYLGGHHIQRPKKITDRICKVIEVFTTHSYAVNSSLFDKILEDLRDVYSPGKTQIDLYLSKLQQKVNAYAFLPNMTGQKSFYSDVENRYADYSDNMDDLLDFDDSYAKMLTVAIPTYEMAPHGHEFVYQSLVRLAEQTFKDFNIVISDHSKDDKIKKVVDIMRTDCNLDIKYVRKTYETDNPSSNMNNAIRHSKGRYIKMLFQDDFLFDRFSLQHTVDAINANPAAKWFASACEHSSDGINYTRPFYPKWNDDLIRGVNTISSPSVITIKNTFDKVFFDLELTWLMDCDYYVRACEKFGLPVFINEITVVNRTHGDQLTNTLTDERKNSEHVFIENKFKMIRGL